LSYTHHLEGTKIFASLIVIVNIESSYLTIPFSVIKDKFIDQARRFENRLHLASNWLKLSDEKAAILCHGIGNASRDYF